MCKAGRWKIVDDLYINDYSRKMLDKNIAELEAEKAAAQSLAPPVRKEQHLVLQVMLRPAVCRVCSLL